MRNDSILLVHWLECPLVGGLCAEPVLCFKQRELSPVGKGCDFFGFQESLANRFYLHLCFWGLGLTSRGLYQIIEECIIYPILGISWGPWLEREAPPLPEVPNLQPLPHSGGAVNRKRLRSWPLCHQDYCAILGYLSFPEEVENFAPSTCWCLSCLFVGWSLLPLFVLCGASRNQLHACGEKGLKDFENCGSEW